MSKALYFDFERVIVVPGEVSDGKDGALRFIAERRIAQRAARMKYFFIFTRLAWTVVTAYALITLGIPKNLLELLPGLIMYYVLINPYSLLSTIRALRWPDKLVPGGYTELPSVEFLDSGKRQHVVVEMESGALGILGDKLHPKALAHSIYVQPTIGVEIFFQSTLLFIAILAMLGYVENDYFLQNEELLSISILSSFVLGLLFIAGLIAIIVANVRLNKLRNAMSPSIADLEKLMPKQAPIFTESGKG